MRKLSFLIIISILFLPFLTKAQEALGNSINFYIESSYDHLKRTQSQATLRSISEKTYWYIDNDWWNGLQPDEKEEIDNTLTSLIEEFETKIYPTLTNSFGSEWSPGIDKDSRITILVHPMIDEAGGYFNSADEYPKIQIPESNEREIIYLNTIHLKKKLAKSFLAHELQHLISFNQKERNYEVSEDVWLNEARSEYAPTLLGYNETFEGSDIQRRIKNFLDKPYDSLTEWRNLPYDYGVTNLFVHYLIDHYGIKVIIDSLNSQKTGIESLNFALSKAGFKEDFLQIFTDWTIAVLINDCSVSQKYCYLNKNLKSFKLAPLINYLPSIGKSVLSVTNTTKDWSGNWHKFIGGNNRSLKLEFAGSLESNFKVPYLIQDDQGNFLVDFLKLDEKQKGIINVPDFGSENVSLTIIPILHNKISDFSDLEPSASFFWSASTIENTKEEDQDLIDRLLVKIEDLKAQIAQIQAQINAILGKSVSCQEFGENLYEGMVDNNRVRCLQEFLKSQGNEIYPEGLVTGNFLSLTKLAVIRFQEKYSNDILTPLNLDKGTGFVGLMTRIKINQLNL
ncbi:MAG: hypothetical protein KJI71_05605 [Patescibacteria group bacterium]|nr:hypothetical protein [Patescibacteria group bacterium]